MIIFRFPGRKKYRANKKYDLPSTGIQEEFFVKKILPGILLLFVFSFSLGCASVDTLVEGKKFKKADRYCNDKSGKEKRTCYRTVGDSYYKYGHYAKALKFYKKSRSYKKQRMARSRLGDAAFEKSNYFTALRYYKDAGDRDGQRKAHDKIADKYYGEEKFILAAMYYKKSKNTEKYRECNNLLGNRYLEEKKYLLAASYFGKADNSEKEKEAYLFAGDIAYKDREYEKASRYYMKAGDERKEKKVNTILANRFYREKDYRKAALYYKKTGNEKKEKWSYYKLAGKYYKDKNYLMASIYYKKSGNEAKAKYAKKQYEKSTKNVGLVTNLIYSYLNRNIYSLKYRHNQKRFYNYLAGLEKKYGTVTVYKGLKNARIRVSSQVLAILAPAMKSYNRTRSTYALKRANRRAARYTAMGKVLDVVLKSMKKK